MNRSDILPHIVAWPTCALGAWAAAWLTGRCSPDDVIEALAESADRHEVQTEQSTSATGSGNGVLELLGMLKPARQLVVRLPSTGDPQGLPPHPATSKALVAGEVLLVDDSDTAGTLALVPEFSTLGIDPPVRDVPMDGLPVCGSARPRSPGLVRAVRGRPGIRSAASRSRCGVDHRRARRTPIGRRG